MYKVKFKMSIQYGTIGSFSRIKSELESEFGNKNSFVTNLHFTCKKYFKMAVVENKLSLVDTKC